MWRNLRDDLKSSFEELSCEKVYISAMRNGYLAINKIKSEKGNIVRETLKALLQNIDQLQCKEVHLYMNSMFSVWACEDIALFKNKPKVVFHMPVNALADDLPILTMNRSFLLYDMADVITFTNTIFDGLTSEMLFITYTGERDKLTELPTKEIIDIKEVVDNLYEMYYAQSVESNT